MYSLFESGVEGIEGFLAECWHNRDTEAEGIFNPEGLALALELLETTDTLSGISASPFSLIALIHRHDTTLDNLYKLTPQN